MSGNDRSTASGEGIGDATHASAGGGATLAAAMGAMDPMTVRGRTFRRADLLSGLAERR